MSVQSNVIEYQTVAPDIYKALLAIYEPVNQYGLDPLLVHLIHLRASQINGCAFCVKMHTKEARDDGETDKRLDYLIVWRHVNEFTAAEKAALAWVEALTVLDAKTDYAPLRAELKKHFSEAQISAMTTIIGMINLWNRFQVSKH